MAALCGCDLNILLGLIKGCLGLHLLDLFLIVSD
jgi:hypothetical protein